MRIIRTDREITEFLELLKKRASVADPEIVNTVVSILRQVRSKGDEALREYTERFDRIKLRDFRFSRAEVRQYARECPPDVYRALMVAARRIREYHMRQKESSWQYKKSGITLGQLIRPLHRVGVYVPGGKAAYPSTVLMNVIPAQVAGVEEIALCVPTPGGGINPALMAAVEITGVREVYRIGGAQAIAALAYGTESIRRVDKIVGPGNIYVALAKKLVFGEVDIDMFAGPSEILVIADSRARPEFVAADLLSQAEHDEMASSVLITTSEKLAVKVAEEVKRQLDSLPKKEIAGTSIQRFGCIIIVRSLSRAVELANSIAPEHLELMVQNPEALLPKIKNAGAIFLGEYSPEPVGDYIAGPNHTLPTSGTARFFSPLGVYDFIKRSSLVSLTKGAFNKLAGYVEVLADVEGLHAHGNTIRIRRSSKK